MPLDITALIRERSKGLDKFCVCLPFSLEHAACER
jgi:hypothetical protein